MTTNDPTACATCGHRRDDHYEGTMRHGCDGAINCACTAYVAPTPTPDVRSLASAVTAAFAPTPVAPAADYEALAALAEAATTGTWRAYPHEVYTEWDDGKGMKIAGYLSDEDAAFVAAANPTTVLALIADLRLATEQGDRYLAEKKAASRERWDEKARADAAEASLRAVEGKRLSWAIFAIRDHDAYAQPFVLVRETDVSGVSGTGVVADGVAFPDGTVALRWRGGNPTSVVFHDNGVESVEKIHGHGGATRLVWLAESLETTSEVAEVYDQRDAAEAAVARVRALIAEHMPPDGAFSHLPGGGVPMWTTLVLRALDGAES